jgi:L-malate glycosyltransferase
LQIPYYMKQVRSVAVVCNYELHENRIGGMDRFFIAYDEVCKKAGYDIIWFFSGGQRFELYNKLNLHISTGKLEYDFIKFHEKHRYDIIITHFIELCTPFYKKLKSLGDPKVIAVDHNPRPLEGFSFEKKLKNRLKGLMYSKYIDQFIGVSQYTKDCILSDFGIHLRQKTSVVYNGIDTEIYIKRTERNFGKFIVASHLRHSKGIHDLILAVSHLNTNAKENISIDIFGNGPLKSKLVGMVKKHGLENIIHFKGSSAKLPTLFQNYSYLLQPTYMECFSLSILESLASNVPVVTTPVGGNEEVIENGVNGYIFPAKNTIVLAELLTGILSEENVIKKDVSEKIEKEFTLQRMVENHFKLLECI